MSIHSCRLLVLFPFLGAWACGGKSVREGGGEASDPSMGGSGPSGAAGVTAGAQGGSAPAGGSKSSGGTSGKATGGASGTSAGGISGTASGGDTGSGGSSGAGVCKSCIPTTCSTTAIPTETINDFDNLLVEPTTPSWGIYGANDAMGVPKPEWWLGYFSGSFAYPVVPERCSRDPVPEFPITRTDTSGELHVTGTVGTYSGFGVWFGPCVVDMSEYSGIAFRIGGSAGPGGVTFRVHTNTNTAPDSCFAGKGTCLGSSTGACSPSGLALLVPETPEVVRVRFETLIGGSPEYLVDPAEVVQLTWAFPWGDGTLPYEVDVTVDDVVLFR